MGDDLEQSAAAEVVANGISHEAGDDGGKNIDVDAAASKKSKAEKLKDKKKKQKQNKQLRWQSAKDRPQTSSAVPDRGVDGEAVEVEYVSAPLDLESLRLSDAAAGPSAPAFASSAGEEEDEDAAGGRGGLGSSSGGGGLGFSGGGLGYGGGGGLASGGGGGLGFSTGGLGSTAPPDESAGRPSSSASAEDALAELRRVFEKFATAEDVTGAKTAGDAEDEEGQDVQKARGKDQDRASSSDEEGGEDGGKKKASKKAAKLASRINIAELKSGCERPDVVEVWDVTAPDPPLLVFLKAYRNTVPVPRHWSQKRKYLQGKRGIEKPAFKLPDNIEATGIGEMRAQYHAKEELKKTKQKQKERMQPKMGKMDIDYQVLHDAFFKHQVRPKLSSLGDIYYEGKEFEAQVGRNKPGVLSDDLRSALGMGDSAPPPWLINMQRYGPPPSYPNLKVAGLNAPIPPGSSFGYHPGGWGKPPVDETGAPLYGDVFGQDAFGDESDDEVDKAQRWGELEADVEESEEEEEEEDDEIGDRELADGIASGIASGMASGMVSGMASGLVSGLASGIASSLPSGIDTPSEINLRKDGGGGDGGAGARALYTVLEQRQTAVGATNLMGSDHVYVVPGTGTAETRKDKRKPGDVLRGVGVGTDVEVALNPEELEGLDDAAIKELYEARAAELRGGGAGREDFSDLVAARAMQQKRKLAQKAEANKKAKEGGGGKDTFKF